MWRPVSSIRLVGHGPSFRLAAQAGTMTNEPDGTAGVAGSTPAARTLRGMSSGVVSTPVRSVRPARSGDTRTGMTGLPRSASRDGANEPHGVSPLSAAYRPGTALTAVVLDVLPPTARLPASLDTAAACRAPGVRESEATCAVVIRSRSLTEIEASAPT